MKHVINFSSLTTKEIKELLNLALDMKANPANYQDCLKNKKLYMLFQKTSTRTFLSFAAGITELGGSYYCQKWEDSNFSLGDHTMEVKYISTSADLFMARLKDHSLTQLFSTCCGIPFINGCDNTYHPCQGLADFLTIRELLGSYEKNILYIGAKNNVFHSLLELSAILGAQLYGLTPLQNAGLFPDSTLNIYEKSGSYVKLSPTIEQDALKKIVQKMDVVYTDTWVDMEFFNLPEYQEEKSEISKKMMPYQINSDLLKSSSCLVMHDMPIHTGYEISQSVIDTHAKTILTQADNRKHTQKALMYSMIYK